jgi:transposase
VGRPGIDACLAAQVAIRRALTEQIRGLDRKIEQLAKSHRHRRRAQLLRTIPGVGTITAMTYLVELGDVMARFETCEDLASFLGLAPGERSSSSKQRKGSTPNGGNKWVGPALVQASWQVIAHDEQLRAVYDRIKAKNPQYGSAIAIVAVARRLALAMRAMLRDDVGWRGQDLPETTDPQDGEVDKMSATRPT